MTRAVLRCTRLLAFLAFALVGLVEPHPAAAQAQSFVDQRVTGLPAAALLREPGSALVDRRRQEAAKTFRDYTRWLFFIWASSQILTFLVLWRSGGAARMRDLLKRTVRSKVALRFIYGALLALVAGVAAFPASLAQYKVDLEYGLTTERVAGWLRDSLTHVALDAIAVGLVVAFIFALVDRTRLWYLLGALGLVVFTLTSSILLPVVVAPLFNRFEPLALNSQLYEPLHRIEREAGFEDDPIYVADVSRRSTLATADVSGLGPTRRVVVSDTLLRKATAGEVVFMTAREFGRYRHGDDLRLSAYGTFLFIFCAAIAVGISDRLGFRRDDDPLARLPLVGAFLGLAALLALPLFNAYERRVEARADQYAYRLTGDRASAVRAFVRFADESLAPLCPSPLAKLYFYAQPPFGTRIAAAQGRPDPCR